MKKRFYLLRLADTCKFIFSLVSIVFVAAYWSAYHAQVSGVLLHAITCMFCIVGVVFVLTQGALGLHNLQAKDHAECHGKFSAIANSKDPYETYCHSLQMHKYHIWWRFVFGIDAIIALAVLIGVVISIDSALVICLSYRDSWGFQQIITPICSIVFLGSIIVVYKKLPRVFRSGAGLVRSLMFYNTSMQVLDENFRNAKRISRDLWISTSWIYYRDVHNVFVINRFKITNYRLLERKIAVEVENGIMPTVLRFHSAKEYNAVSQAILRSKF